MASTFDDQEKTSPTVEPIEKIMQVTIEDRSCWTLFVYTSVLALSGVLVLVYSMWESPLGSKIQVHSTEYFMFCVLGGVLSGLPHLLVTPLDLLKCRIQCGEYASFGEGVRSILAEASSKGLLGKIGMFYRGWAPTAVGYLCQGALKFGLYELFKFKYALMFDPQVVLNHQVLLYLCASASAEFCADIALAPWEAMKVKIQTTRTFPPKLNVVLPRIYAQEGWRGFYKGLPPLWGRQIPYTMVKFATFESTVMFIYAHVLMTNKAHVSPVVQLFVSLASGCISGAFCAIVSHPADTLVSKLNQRSDSRNLLLVVRDIGCRDLWKGLVPRIMMIGCLTALQWVIYDTFKVAVGLPTTGGGGGGKK